MHRLRLSALGSPCGCGGIRQEQQAHGVFIVMEEGGMLASGRVLEQYYVPVPVCTKGRTAGTIHAPLHFRTLATEQARCHSSGEGYCTVTVVLYTYSTGRTYWKSSPVAAALSTSPNSRAGPVMITPYEVNSYALGYDDSIPGSCRHSVTQIYVPC